MMTCDAKPAAIYDLTLALFCLTDTDTLLLSVAERFLMGFPVFRGIFTRGV